MKTYDEVINRCALQVFGRYMGGSYDYWREAPINLVAWIFEKRQAAVQEDMDKAFKHLCSQQYRKSTE